jgi:hypothetical protein
MATTIRGGGDGTDTEAVDHTIAAEEATIRSDTDLMLEDVIMSEGADLSLESDLPVAVEVAVEVVEVDRDLLEEVVMLLAEEEDRVSIDHRVRIEREMSSVDQEAGPRAEPQVARVEYPPECLADPLDRRVPEEVEM